MLIAEQGPPAGRNHPHARRMAVIAFINYNLAIACMWGSFSILLGPVEARLGVSRELSTLGAPAINLATALCAPIAGVLATRLSLRLIMLAGAILTLAGYATLALTTSYPLYLAAFALLLGPGMAIAVIMPGTLVTRWFAVNRGRALGIVTTPALIGAMPLVISRVLQGHGVVASYLTLAAFSGLSVIACLFIQDRPPASDTAGDIHDEHAPSDRSIATLAQLARAPRFWALFIAFAASATSSIVIGAHMVPMLRSWGIAQTAGATLLSIYFFSAIPGTIAYGWIADRLGAVQAMVILAAGSAAGWIALLEHPGFAVLAVLMVLIGTAGAGVVPVFGLALSEIFGRESFSRAFGLANLAVLPFSVLCVPAVALVFTRTGSYAGAVVGMAAFLALTALAAASAWRRRAGQMPAT